MNDKEINNARRMLEAIYRLAEEHQGTAMSDIRFFARAAISGSSFNASSARANVVRLPPCG